MGDVAIRQSEFEWMIKPPATLEKNTTFTVVGRIPGRVEFQVLEAVEVKDSGETGQRWEGDGTYTGPGFNDDGVESTYVWFFIKLERLGKYKTKFRMTWRKGAHLFGAVETFEIKSTDDHDEPRYSKYNWNLPPENKLK
ncbi:hypothetical protein ANO14919_105210 [Xylariales sp. No.14919]|nr:hypothetical protein ANO14919_105210 [Xylariales sp. No.14919]